MYFWIIHAQTHVCHNFVPLWLSLCQWSTPVSPRLEIKLIVFRGWMADFNYVPGKAISPLFLWWDNGVISHMIIYWWLNRETRVLDNGMRERKRWVANNILLFLQDYTYEDSQGVRVVQARLTPWMLRLWEILLMLRHREVLNFYGS